MGILRGEKFLLRFLISLVLSRLGFAQAPTPVQTAASPEVRVETTVVNEHTLQLRIAFAEGGKAPSLFIAAGAGAAPAGEPAAQGNLRGVKGPAGALLVDRTGNQWTLLDERGQTVISAPLPALYRDARTGKPLVMAPLGSPPKETQFYGSGDLNGTGIAQPGGQGRVGNGTTGVPYYWTTAGYSVLALGEDDNAPASWQRGADGAITWSVPGNSMTLYLTPTASLKGAAEDYATLTGRPPVPPRWALGYMQSRWGWRDRAYVEDTLQQFTDRKLPVDAFIFDFEWYTAQNDYAVPAAGASGYSDFSWNPALFPEPEKQIAEMHAKGVHVVGIRKPRLGNLESLTQLRDRGWITAIDSAVAPTGRRGRGTEQRLLDFSKTEVRDWYAAQMAPLLKAGIDGWWNDEGEQTYTMYTYWNQSEVQAQKQVDAARRVWTINRAFAPGLQKYGAAAWAGDFLNNWQGLAATPPRLLNWSLAGMYYGACDIGGFQGNISGELLTRWMQAGVFFPVMRSHSSNTVTPRFPWLYGAPAEAAIRKALELRYRLVPYYYSLAHEAAAKGTPLMRPLVMAFPKDPQVADLTSQWMMGEGLMAAPILTQNNQRSVYFPKETWYTFDSNRTRPGGEKADVTAALDEIPVYVRAGTILPLGPVIQHTDETPGGPLDLQIYPGADAAFTLTEDDGQSTAYMKGELRRTVFTWNDATRTLAWKMDGAYRGKDVFRQMKITLFDPAAIVTRSAALEESGQMTLAR